MPAVNVGSRQLRRERGRNVIDVGYDRAAIEESVRTHLRNGRAPSDAIYGDGHSGKRIADLLATEPLTVEKQLTY